MNATRLIAFKPLTALFFVVTCVPSSLSAQTPSPAPSPDPVPDSAQVPLHQRIDQQIATIHPGPPLGLCSDGDFLRRIFLDLIGTVPSTAEAREFIQDQSADKREKIVDKLLADPRMSNHFARCFDVMLMERRADKYVKRAEWEGYLLTSFQSKKPLNELAREILAADSVDPSKHPAAKFYLDRETEPNLLTREVGRMFFGMDLQCAQCHDHPSIDDYYQSDYYGIFAFLNRSYLFQPDKKKAAIVAEKAEGDVNFKSVFTDEEGSTRPRLPGQPQIDEPVYGKDDAYKVKPDPKKKEVQPIPKFSRRERLAALATDGSNGAFNRNLANRLWAHMTGRGIVHPVDQHHSANPPADPILLAMLADELRDSNFDLRVIVRGIALSNTYQRQIELPARFEQHLSAAQESIAKWRSLQEGYRNQASEVEAKIDEQIDQRDALASKVQELSKLEAGLTKALEAAKKVRDEARTNLEKANSSLSAERLVQSDLKQAVTSTTEATKKIGDDQELAAVLKTLESKLSQVDARVAKSMEATNGAKTKFDSAEKDFVQAEASANENEAGIRDAEAKLSKVDRGLAPLQEKYLLNRTQVSHADRQIERLQIAIDYGKVQQDHRGIEKRVKEISDQIVAHNEVLRNKEPEQEELAKKVAASKNALQRQQDKLRQDTHALQQHNEILGLLVASHGKAQQAAARLESDQELRAAVSTLSEKVSQRRDVVRKGQSAVEQLHVSVSESMANLASVETQLGTVSTAVNRVRQELAVLQPKLDEQRRLLQGNDEKLKSLEKQLADTWAKQFSVSVIQPLSPEQLAISMMTVTGYDLRLRQSAISTVDKKSPLKPEDKENPQKIAEYEQRIDQQYKTNVAGVVAKFVKLFGSAPGQPQDDFFATVDQALFFGNAGDLRTWLAPTGGNLTDRLQKIEDSKQLAEEVYLSVMTRMPTDSEVAEIAEYLSQSGDKKAAIQQISWALITSAEFRFHH